MWIINWPKGNGTCYNPLILEFLEKQLSRNRKKPAFDLSQKQVSLLAQREGFEPSCDCSQTDFESFFAYDF